MSTDARIDMGALVTDATRIYFASFPRIALVAVLSHVPIMLVDAFQTLSMTSVDSPGFGGLTQLSMILGTIALAITSAYVVPPVMSSLGHRRAPTFAEVSARVGAALGTAWLTNLIVGLGVLCFVIPGVIASLWFCVAIPASVAEGMTARRAMDRSKELTEGYRSTALALNLGYGGLLIAVVIASVVPTVLVEMDASASGHPVNAWLMVALTVLPTAVQSLVVAYGSALFTVFYARLREVKDGVDADALAAVFA